MAAEPTNTAVARIRWMEAGLAQRLPHVPAVDPLAERQTVQLAYHY